jgi:hypothetical protein
MVLPSIQHARGASTGRRIQQVVSEDQSAAQDVTAGGLPRRETQLVRVADAAQCGDLATGQFHDHHADQHVSAQDYYRRLAVDFS